MRVQVVRDNREIAAEFSTVDEAADFLLAQPESWRYHYQIVQAPH